MSIITWQGLRLEVPDSWNPVRIEGDWGQGQILFADLDKPRLGIRWRNFKRGMSIERAMRDEVGQLAAAESRPFKMMGNHWRASMLYLEPESPGRDVWIGISSQSDRLVEVVYHTERASIT